MTRRQYSDPFGSDDEDEMSPEEMNVINSTESRKPLLPLQTQVDTYFITIEYYQKH